MERKYFEIIGLTKKPPAIHADSGRLLKPFYNLPVAKPEADIVGPEV